MVSKREIIIVSLIIALAFLGFGYLNYSYKMKKLEQARLDEARQEHQLKSCLREADETYRIFWNRTCSGLGKKENCFLLPSYYERIDKAYTEDRNNCIKMWAN